MSETDVCNSCHSNGGVYDGVTSASGSIGAKDNWRSGIYNSGALQSGKEMWCAGCHDDVPANSRQDGSGVNAGNKMGDNVTYGYNVTGHGNDPAVKCIHCHSALKPHIDHVANSKLYRFYDGKGMELPTVGVPETSESALCYSCHSETLISDNNEATMKTNFRSVNYNVMTNLHTFHVLWDGWT